MRSTNMRRWTPPTPEEEMERYGPGRYGVELEVNHAEVLDALTIVAGLGYQAMTYHNDDEVFHYEGMLEMLAWLHQRIDLEGISRLMTDALVGHVGQYIANN